MWRLETAFAATPWALPGLVGVLVVAAGAAVPLRRRYGWHPLLGALLVVGVGAPLVITLTPTPVILEMGVGSAGGRFCHVWPPPSAGALVTNHEDWLNIAMLVPLGIAVALLASVRQRRIALAVAASLPPAIEAVQYAAAPWLGRSCQIDDVIQNWLGVLVGVALGVVVRRLWSRSRRR